MGVLDSCGPCELRTLFNSRIGPRAAEMVAERGDARSRCEFR